MDIKSIENRRAAPCVAEARVNGIVQAAKKSFKKAEKEDEMAKFLANSDDIEKMVESDEEENTEQPQDKKKYTEEEYLKVQNLKLKEQLLQSSSESADNFDDSDIEEDRVNGNMRFAKAKAIEFVFISKLKSFFLYLSQAKQLIPMIRMKMINQKQHLTQMNQWCQNSWLQNL